MTNVFDNVTYENAITWSLDSKYLFVANKNLGVYKEVGSTFVKLPQSAGMQYNSTTKRIAYIGGQ
jgi:hypothetical protein